MPIKAMDDTYTPVTRDRATERERCERDIPGYREERLLPSCSASCAKDAA
jgi:hypothetical protein